MKAHTKNITHLFEHPYIVSIDDVFYSTVLMEI